MMIVFYYHQFHNDYDSIYSDNYSSLTYKEMDLMQEESMQTNKKQCTGGSKKAKSNTSVATKDPQSIAAKVC